MVEKTCKKHGDLSEKEIYIMPSGWLRCRICARYQAKKNRTESPEKAAALNKRWYERHPGYRANRSPAEKEKFNAAQNKYYNDHKDRYAELRRKNSATRIAYQQKCIINLADWYIKKIITRGSSITGNDVAPEWVDLKRTVIKIKRKIRDRNEN